MDDSGIPWPELAAAIGLGLYSGFSPGPTLALVITQTLRFGRVEGLKVAIAPLLTDAPIAALALLLLSRLKNSDAILGAISLAGAVFLVVVALECFRGRAPAEGATVEAPHSILKGVLANALNPHPYLGWLTVVGPMMLRAAGAGWVWAVVFVVLFYVVMVGSKMLVAVLVERGGSVLRSRGYRVLMIALGAMLLVFAGRFVMNGLAMIQLWGQV